MSPVARQLAPDPRGDAPGRLREAAGSWVLFFAEHTVDHPMGRCPVSNLYASWLRWAADRGQATAPLAAVVTWMREGGYRVSGPREGGANPDEHAVWFGLIGREYDPRGWPATWQWPWLDAAPPPSWYVARSRLRRRRDNPAREGRTGAPA